MDLSIRAAVLADVDDIVAIWMEGWHAAHAAIVPKSLVRLRTRDSFRERVLAHLAKISVAVGSHVLGFYYLDDDELDQFYVSKTARGKGVATAMMLHAEAQLTEAGHATAWLGCAIGNDRAARFYEKAGWVNTGPFDMELETSEGLFLLTTWRFEKTL